MGEPPAIDEVQTAQEQAFAEVGEAMLSVEAAIKRVERAAAEAARLQPGEAGLQLALKRAIKDLEAIRRRLHHDAYLDAAHGRLF